MFPELLVALRDYSYVLYLKFKFRNLCSEYIYKSDLIAVARSRLQGDKAYNCRTWHCDICSVCRVWMTTDAISWNGTRFGRNVRLQDMTTLRSSAMWRRKGKFHPRTGHEGPDGEQKYSPTLSLSSALHGVGGKRHAPAALPPGKTRGPLYRRLGFDGWGKSRRHRGFNPRTTQPVASRHTEYSVPTPWFRIVW